MNITMQEIADRAGVTKMTVSRVLNKADVCIKESTRRKVQRIAREMNYTPNQAARSLKTGKTRIIGITSGTGVPVRQVFNSPYFSNLYSGIGDTIADHGYRMLVQQDEGNTAGDGSLEMLTAKMVDGIIFVLLSECIDDFLEKQLPLLHRLDVPYRIITTVGTVDDPATTGVDSRAAARKTVGHLLGHGYRDIGFLYYQRGENRFNDEVEAGFNAAVLEAGLAEKDTVRLVADHLGAEEGYRIIDELLQAGRPLPRALFCSQVTLAHGAMHRMREAGIRIPGECAVAAYGLYAPDAFLFSGLTTMEMPALEMGRAAAAALLQGIDGQETGIQIIEPVLHTRTSCGCGSDV